MHRRSILLFKAPYVTSVLVMRSCYASNPRKPHTVMTVGVITLVVLTGYSWHFVPCPESFALKVQQTSNMTCTDVTYGALNSNDKMERRCIETVNLSEILVGLDSSASLFPAVLVLAYPRDSSWGRDYSI